MNKNGLIYGVHDRPKFSSIIIFALQQILAIITATIAVPQILGLPMSIPSALLGAGLGTLTYLIFTKGKSPAFLSSSFAYLNALSIAMAFGYMGIIVGSIFAGSIYIIIAIIIKFTGTDWLNKLMPTVIIGPVVILIGLSLATNAVSNAAKADNFIIDGANGGYNLIAVICALITAFAIIFFSIQSKKKGLQLIPFVLGVLIGYVVGSIFTAIGLATNNTYLQVINWNYLIDNFVKDGQFKGIEAFITFPKLAIVEAIKELVSGNISEAIMVATNNQASLITPMGVVEIAIAFIPIAFVSFAEHIADHKNLSSIIGNDLTRDPGLHRTLLGDGVGSIVGTFFGICPNTTYGESVACVGTTKNASVITIFCAAIGCVILSSVTPVTAFAMTIPSSIMGGTCLILYGFISFSGFKIMRNVDLEDKKNFFTIAVILIAGVGGLAINIPYSLNPNGTPKEFITVSAIATALILGLITYNFCKVIENKFIEKEVEDNSKK